MDIELDVFGDTQLKRRLLRFADRADDMTPAFEKVVDHLIGVESLQFNTQGAYASGGWKPLAPSTIKRKAYLGLDPRILHATRALSRSLTSRGAPGQVVTITRDEMFFGTGVKSDRGFPYPAVHQNPKQGQTQRRPIELRPSDRVDVVKILQEHLVEGLSLDG